MNTFKKILNFTKIEHTLFSLPLLFAGAAMAEGGRIPSIRVMLLIVLAGSGARILGISMNRILDRKIDAKNPRTKNRELPSGELSLLSAWVIAFSGLGLYLLACRLLNPLVFMLSPAPAAVLILYSFLKRFTILCHFGIGLCMGIAPLAAYIAASGNLSFTPDLLKLAGFAFFWMSGFDIIYALQDIEFDRKQKIRSLPAAVGSFKANIGAGLCHIAAMILIALIPMGKGAPSAPAYLALLIAMGGFIFAYMPKLSLPARFFPVSAVVGVAGALASIL